jgi:ribosomal-protein-serine acetyltransferase
MQEIVEDLTVRPWQTGDAEGLYRAVDASRAELTRWLPWCSDAYAAADAAAWVDFSQRSWDARSLFPLGVFDAYSGEVLGGTGINHLDLPNRRGALGYWVSSAHAGRGIARRAAAVAAAFGFRELGLCRIEIIVLPGNHASHRVARALGAIHECDARHRVQHHGRSETAAVYSLLPEDLRERPR